MVWKAAALAVACGVIASTPATAEQFQKVRDKDTFVSLVNGRDLTRFGIRLNVTPQGQIQGKAFGQPVTGKWDWSDGYFCRDLYLGEQDLGANCQAVAVNGETVRFISDRGEGIYADLRLD